MLELIIIIIALILFTKKNETSENKSASTISSAKTKDSDYENSSDYENRSDYEKSELYFHHRMEIVLKKKYPELISWRMTRQGVSLLNQAIEVVVTLPEEKKERIWINQHELIGSFKILPEEVSENDIADESIPDDLREFFELNAGIINERIRIAVEKKNNYAYFSFSNNESEDLKKRIVTKLEQTIDGAMFSLCDNQLEMNVQNLLDD